jgi:chlorophyllide a reductase subunit Z
LFDALFNILPLARQMDAVAATPARNEAPLSWDDEAKAEFDALVEAQPVLVRISAAKHIRDAAERDARLAGEAHVSRARLSVAARQFESQHA